MQQINLRFEIEQLLRQFAHHDHLLHVSYGQQKNALRKAAADTQALVVLFTDRLKGGILSTSALEEELTQCGDTN